MKHFVWMIFVLFSVQAFAGTCPSGANYMSLTNPTGSLVALSTFGVNSCYFIAANGSDSNDGASEASGHPWLHAPGMPNCTANCASHTPTSGDGFILRGGDTWHVGASTSPSTGGTMALSHSGSSSNYIYYGVDPAWYAAGTWQRPIFTGDNSLSTSPVSSCSYQGFDFIHVAADYIILDNFELTGMCWSTSYASYVSYVGAGVSGAGNPAFLENLYVHGWTRTTGAIQAGGSGLVGNNQYYGETWRFNVIDGQDSDYHSLNPWGNSKDGYDLEYNVTRYAGGTSVFDYCHIHHDNLFEYMSNVTDGSTHTDVDFCYGEYGGGSGNPNLYYNNVFRYIGTLDTAPVSYSFVPGNDGTDYLFNNVSYEVYDTSGGSNYLVTCDQGTCGAKVIWNSTCEGALPGYTACWAIGDTTITSVNNHWITNNGSTTSAIFVNTLPGYSVTESTSLYQTHSTANGQGYTAANGFSPTSPSNSTVTASGTNETSGYCADSVLHNAAAEGACKLGITGVSYNSSAHTVVFPAYTAVPRPSSGSWNVGAYQLSSTVATPTFSPAAGSYSIPQWTTVSDSTSTSTIYCTVDGSTPTTSSMLYSHSLYVAASQTLKCIATAAGYTNSAVGSAAYTIATQATQNSLSTTAASITPPILPKEMRICCGTGWGSLETARGTYALSGFSTWLAHAATMGARALYTLYNTPSWAGASSSSPPSDLTSSAACQGVLTGTTTTDCQLKEFTIKLMQTACGVSSQPGSPLTGVCNLDVEGWNEFNTGSWSGTVAQLAQMQSDVSYYIHLYCGDCLFIAGSTSAGGDGTNGRWDTNLETLLQDIAGLAAPSFPDAVSYHAYPSRTTVTPVPFPTTLASNSSATCTTGNTPNTSCRTAIKDQTGVAQSATILQNAAIASWAKYLPVWVTEGGWGILNGVCDGADCDPSHANVQTLRTAYASQWLLTLAGTPTVMWYEYGQDCAWGILYGPGDPTTCVGNPALPSGDLAWYKGYGTTAGWLNSASAIGTLSSASVSGGNVWTLPLTISGKSAQIVWYDGWLTTTTQSTSFVTQQTLAGVSSSTGGSYTVGQMPILLTTSPGTQCVGISAIGVSVQ